MGSHTSLCFTGSGLINPRAVEFARYNKSVDLLVLVSDGSRESIDHMIEFVKSDTYKKHPVQKIAICRTPRHEVRVRKIDGTISKPTYMLNDEVKIKWICARIAAPAIDIYMSDTTSQSQTQVKLERDKAEMMCYVSYQLWSLMLIAEQRLAFPAAVIDRLTRWSYSLNSDTVDILQLRSLTGLGTLDYNSHTDLISIEVDGDVFTAKLSVLNDIYSKLILPLFNRMYGRRYRMMISVTSPSGHTSNPVDMTYGELGRVIKEMCIYLKEQEISELVPMDPEDLKAYARRIKIQKDNCIWIQPNEDPVDVIMRSTPDLVHRPRAECGDVELFGDTMPIFE